MKTLALIGGTSNLSQEIVNRFFQESSFDITVYSRTPDSIGVKSTKLDANNICIKNITESFYIKFDVYIFNLGILIPKNILEQSEDEIFNSLKINALFTIKACEHILSTNPNARILIVGSESGKKGSYDTSYFLSKTMLRSYVKERMLHSHKQQLVLVSPSTIEDGTMTTSRNDVHRLELYKNQHPKKRFVTCSEIANLLYDLAIGTNYISNCEIEVNGGKFARMDY